MSSQPSSAIFLDQIHKALSQKAYVQADALYQKLMEIHPAALSEVLKAGTAIEEAKTAGLDESHIARWSDLYQDMTEEEVNAFFYSLKKAKVPVKKRIVAHGAANSKLFFIEQGEVAVFITKEGRHKGIARLSSGDILGESSFTDIALSSVSAVTTNEVEVRYIESAVAENWIEDYPGLYDRVVKFCNKTGRAEKLLRKAKIEKRISPRYRMTGKVVATLLKDGKKSDLYMRGALTDISRDGCCFEMHCSRREIAQSFLGCAFQLDFEIGSGELSVVGKIVKLAVQIHSDYTAHLRFEKSIAEEDMEKILNS